MPDVRFDSDAWNAYPQHRWLFNKLELALRLGYCAGPGGVSVPKDGDYIIRPVYNLSGMGVGARRAQLKRGDTSSVRPGEFWCEYFHGPQITIDYEWGEVNGSFGLRPVFAAQGYRTSQEMYRFSAWHRIDPPHWRLPQWLNTLSDVPRFNIEFIHDQIIEIHLRSGVDFPPGATDIIPIWEDMTDAENQMFLSRGYKLELNYDDADGHLSVSRLGFFYR